ncbi:MAG: methyl-accepting chemotaxis protein [Treponema sp.]|jgi:methyl-accepting chemotaxis protein|nr:methyl-accepting chemotaxis protein [Treponema sp.]
MARDKKNTGSILLKIAGVSSGIVLITVIIMAFISITDIKEVSLETAMTIASTKIKGDITSLSYIIEKEYGILRLDNNSLLDETGVSLENRFELIDQVSTDLGVVATIFMKDGDDFKRITTSIVDGAGKRVVGTVLGKASAAYTPVSRGERYIGNAAILGASYLAGYEPIFAPGGRTVIGILFVGIPLSDVHTLIESRSINSIITIVIISAGLLVLSIILNSLFFRSIIVKPIQQIVTILKAVSEGNLVQRVTVKNTDEIGNMALYVNQMEQNIGVLITLIKEQADKLLQIGTNLAANMNETATVVHEISANTESIKNRVGNQAVSVNHAGVSMDAITHNIDELNGHIQQQTGDIEKSSSAVEEMLANIASVTQTLNANVEKVKGLAAASENGRTGLFEVSQDIQEIAKDSEGLKEINSVIANIASQTNLLSMNAAIEAAHAGESGKGFAVVADEIRKLAESSNAQAKTVSQVLQKIQLSIKKITASTNEVMAKFETIDGGIRTVTVQEEHLRDAMEEQNSGSKQILDAIGGLLNKNQSVKAGSEAMLGRSAEVIEESKKLENITAEITVGMDEMATGASQINNAVQDVNKISAENRENIERLIAEVSKFKI